jgi:hypothetical protein
MPNEGSSKAAKGQAQKKVAPKRKAADQPASRQPTKKIANRRTTVRTEEEENALHGVDEIVEIDVNGHERSQSGDRSDVEECSDAELGKTSSENSSCL